MNFFSAWRDRVFSLLSGCGRSIPAMKTLLAWAACVAATGAIAGNGLSAIGDAAMKPLMDAWCAAQPCERGRWEFGSDALAISTVMFERADMAPLARPLTPAETAPYAHQFAGDMMKTPLAIRVATRGGEPAFVLVNKRPGAPLPQRTKDFLAFALGPKASASSRKARASRRSTRAWPRRSVASWTDSSRRWMRASRPIARPPL